MRAMALRLVRVLCVQRHDKVLVLNELAYIFDMRGSLAEWYKCGDNEFQPSISRDWTVACW